MKASRIFQTNKFINNLINNPIKLFSNATKSLDINEKRRNVRN